ncbi:hypothetical protein DDD_0511 [Nonlabens dokdonensis DSW-6]|uniref:Uncharacterized protein n=1 Tax=Nonlabens dokdonensis (strain DSM 17205 / KCTC 12402 / DSW-6) TaxID=592029 RepID=L7W9S8_NONDD|nr:hypothetical protein DDD_0511 [Nonlabens dokdonensis DSW-6]
MLVFGTYKFLNGDLNWSSFLFYHAFAKAEILYIILLILYHFNS